MAYQPIYDEGERFVIKNSYGDRRYLQWPMQLTNVTGIAMPNVRQRTVHSPFQHGDTYLGFSLDPRVVQVALSLRECTRHDLWLMRRGFMTLISPLTGTLRFRAEFSDGTIFELHNVVYDTGFDMGYGGMNEPAQQAIGARFIAHDPVWYQHPSNIEGPSLTVLEGLVFGDVTPPSTMIFPITFGAVHIDESVSITNGGNWMAFPTFTLTGPMYYPRIENLTTLEVLQLNHPLVDGEIVTISTAFGNKTVTSSIDGNILGSMDPSSDLATFHLDPDPIAADGTNIITFFAGNCTASSGIQIEWYDRWIGI